MTQMTSQINSVLAQYGHQNKTYKKVGSFVEKWTANDLNYTATITITVDSTTGGYARKYKFKFNRQNRER